MGLQPSLGQLTVDGCRGGRRQHRNRRRMGLQRAPRYDQASGDRRGGRSSDADPVGDLFFAGFGERCSRSIGRGGRNVRGALRCGAPAEDCADRGHADGLVDDPRQPPRPVLVARDEPDGDRDEADRDERDDDVLGQNQTSHVGRGMNPTSAGMLAPRRARANRTRPSLTAPDRPGPYRRDEASLIGESGSIPPFRPPRSIRASAKSARPMRTNTPRNA